MDLADRCIPIVMSPAVRELEPILADDDRLHQLRGALYRYTLLHGSQIFMLPSYTNRAALGATLGFSARTWELLWPLEVIFEWLSVPEEHRIAARDFYRKSIPSVKADLDPWKRDLLCTLVSRAAPGQKEIVVRSNELRSCLPEAPDGLRDVDPGLLGRTLKALGLVVSDRRIMVNGKKVTEWKINAERVNGFAHSWGIKSLGEEAA
jgi:hypothetical protein